MDIERKVHQEQARLEYWLESWMKLMNMATYKLILR
jgi:hypothetical protein